MPARLDEDASKSCVDSEHVPRGPAVHPRLPTGVIDLREYDDARRAQVGLELETIGLVFQHGQLLMQTTESLASRNDLFLGKLQ